MGVVYLAEDLVLQRHVALKLLYPAFSSDERFVERFRQEARLVSGVTDPHVVHINNLSTEKNCLAIDMEYVDGFSLHHFITREFVPPAMALRIVREILLGLSACHHHGLVHCDIKPSNVLLPARGPAKLADFGLARAYTSCLDISARDRSTTGPLFGTPIYSPPELWDGAKPSPASDLFSVGVVLYEMLSGEVPYAGPTPLAVIKSMLAAPLPPLAGRAPNVSPQLCEFVERLLQQDPDARPADASDVLTELTQLPEYRPEDDKSPTVGIPRIPRRSGSKSGHGFRFVAGGLLLLLFVLGMVWFVYRGNQQPVTVAQPETTLLPAATGEDDVQSSPDQAIRQVDLLREGLPSAAEFLAAWKDADPAACRLFDVSALDGGYPGFSRWLVYSQDDTGFNDAIGYSDTGLLNIHRTTATGDTITLDGMWADYRIPAGSGFREGTVSGVGQWLPGRSGLAVSLSFTDTTANLTWSSYVTARPASVAQTDTQFFYDLEARDTVLPLLYDELLPRRRAWAANLAPRLTCLRESQVDVPLLQSAPQVNVDGILDESLWTSRYLDSAGSRMGIVTGYPIESKGEVLIRAGISTVYMGIRIPAGRLTGQRLRLTVLPRLVIPSTRSATYTVEFDRAGTVVDSRGVLGDREVVWAPDWTAGAHQDDRTWTFEIAIPASNLNVDVHGSSIWRFNGAVLELESGKEMPVYQWGFPNTEDALHGISAVFKEPLEIQPLG